MGVQSACVNPALKRRKKGRSFFMDRNIKIE
jgi:hypothetical protein